jgi:hypothetical protein
MDSRCDGYYYIDTIGCVYPNLVKLDLVDPENIGERRISNNRDGSSNYEYHIRVSSNRSLELAISIINQRYQAY